MNYLQVVFLYTFSCSALLVYGIGLEKSYFESRPGALLYTRLPVMTLELCIIISASRFIVNSLLIPYSLSFLIPISILMLAGFIQILSKIIRKDTSGSPPGERLMLLGTVLLSVFESVSYLDSLLIMCSAVLSFIFWTLQLSSIRDRIDSSRLQADWNGTPVVLVCLGLLSIAAYSTDVSWWIQELIK